jgi:hypothetical protein
VKINHLAALVSPTLTATVILRPARTHEKNICRLKLGCLLCLESFIIINFIFSGNIQESFKSSANVDYVSLLLLHAKVAQQDPG